MVAGSFNPVSPQGGRSEDWLSSKGGGKRGQVSLGNGLLPPTSDPAACRYMSMSYAVVFETDTLPMFIGEYTTLDEAYEVAIRLVKDFKESGLPSLYKFRIESH